MKKILTSLAGIFLNSTARLFPQWNGNIAFAMLCMVKRKPLKPKTASFYETAQTHLIPCSRDAVALHKWGSGKKNLLFLHGWKSNASQWRSYVQSIDLNEYTLYALDAPGHGQSVGTHLNVELYREAITLAIDKIGSIDTLVCHSLGSLAGSYMHLHNPHLPVDKFIIMGSPIGIQAIFDYFQARLQLSKKCLQNLKSKISSVLLIPLEDLHLAQFFAKATKPVLVIHETSDSITPFLPIKKALKDKSHIQRLFTKGQDHMLREEQTIFAVKNFIQNN